MTFPFHLPGRVGNTIRFSNAGSWQSYQIPIGCIALQILAIGQGGNGGSGFTRAAGLAGGGGGGGGSGGITRAWVPTIFLPAVLFVQPGAGATPSMVSLGPQIQDMLTVVRANGGGNGGNGTGAAIGAAGTAGGLPTTGQGGPFGQYAQYSETVGLVGSAGGAVAGGAGVGFTITTRQLSTGGAGGGGTTSADFAGGTINGGFGLVASVQGGAAGSNDGGHGVFLERPFFCTGGAGGGSSNTGVGGAGGRGAPGCGGGGGGAGTTGGLGGAGGQGLVFITELY